MAKKYVWIMFSICLMLPAGLIQLHSATPKNSSSVVVTRNLLPLVTLTDVKLIQDILEQCLVAESNVTRMEILDINQNGFGEKDIIRLYPSGKNYVLENISSDVQKIMDSWGFQANFQITSSNKPPAAYDSVETDKAAYSIFSTLLRGLNRNYHDFPIKIRFDRDSVGVVFEMWGYNQDRLEIDNPQPFMPDSVITYDIFHVFHDDTLVNVDSKLYDIIHIYYQSADTIFVGQQLPTGYHNHSKGK
ncbi:hypothetical protein L0128_12570 [candidate division KSB1 bacterium]|nr:hypothetical protein [candidate division KSB1 bacterium]